MKKIIRTILFILVAILFLVLVPIIIGYSQGYRFDFEKKAIVQTGGIYLKVYPAQAKVYIDDKFKGQTRMINDDILIQNLLPKKHKIKVEKDGYFAWEKELEVEKKMVTDAKNIILFPNNLKFNQIDSDVKNFYELSDGSFLILKKDSIYLLNTQEEIKKLTVISPLLESLEIINVFSFPENSNLILKFTDNKTKIYYYLFNFKKIETSPQLLNFLDENSKNFFFDYKNNDIFYYQDKNKLKKINLTAIKELPETIVENILTYTLFKNYIYYLTEDGIIESLDLESQKTSPILDKKIEINKEADYQISKINDDIFIKNNDCLYLLKENELEKFLNSVKTAILSPDEKKLLIITNNEFWLFIQREIQVPFLATPQQKLFLSRFSQEVKNPLWIQDDYFLFTLGDKIKISEIDTRSKLNIIDLAEFKEPRVLFDKNHKAILVLSEEKLYLSEKFLP